MQEPQSSSTLNNYISGAENNQESSHNDHESSSPCVDCRQIIRIQKQSASESDSGSSSGDDGELVQPLHRHIIEHSRHIQAQMAHLHQQIERLKSANSSKEHTIEQLRKQLKQVQVNSKISQSMQEQAKQGDFLRRQKQIQQIRKEIYQNSQNLMNFNRPNSQINQIHELNDKNSVNEELKRRLKKVEVMFEDKSRGFSKNVDSDKVLKDRKTNHKKTRQARDDSESSSESSDDEKRNKKQRRGSYDRRKSGNQESSSTNQRESEKGGGKNHLIKKTLQRQNDIEQKESSIQQELNHHFEKIRRLEKHIQFCEMGQKLMGVFNEPVMKEHWNMKKKSKVSWRYTKHILSYLIP